MPGVARVLLTMPLYFALITLATWVALFELLFRPFHWGKTEHGREKAKLEAEAMGATTRPWLSMER